MSEYRNGNWSNVPLEGDRRRLLECEGGGKVKIVAEVFDGRLADRIVSLLNNEGNLRRELHVLREQLAQANAPIGGTPQLFLVEDRDEEYGCVDLCLSMAKDDLEMAALWVDSDLAEDEQRKLAERVIRCVNEWDGLRRRVSELQTENLQLQAAACARELKPALARSKGLCAWFWRRITGE